jgi:Flp pilus assembly protein TadD
MERLFLNLGIQCTENGLWKEAEEAFRKALEANPHYAHAYSNLGFVLQQTRRFAEAESCLRKALVLDAKMISAYNNLSLLLMDTLRWEEAEGVLRQAVQLSPKTAELHNNLGSVYLETNRPRQAEASFRQAVKAKPSFAEAHYNLGCLFKSLNRLEAAEDSLRRALKLQPQYTDAQFALATLYLLRGQFSKGWQNYNALRMRQHASRAASLPRWQGEDLAGKRLLLFYEQGFGDTLQFCRYIPLAAAQAAQATIWVQPQLQRLLQASWPELAFYSGEEAPAQEFDYACALPNLPMLFGAANDTLSDVSYLNAPVAECLQKTSWLKENTAIDTFKIGLVWAGNPQHHNDRNRSLPLDSFIPLLALPGISWISLQAQIPAESAGAWPEILLDASRQLQDFAATAALIANLDLVITVDSAVAHLAGALGKKVWTLIPFAPDWRWQLKRADSPWYASMRLFRQPKPGDWQTPLAAIRQELQNMDRGTEIKQE